jgi:hypothetical protein
MPDSLLPSAPQSMELSPPAKQFLPIFDPRTHEEMRQVLEDNLGPRGLTPRQLDRIKVPTGGAQMFSLQGIAGEEALREITGIVLAWTDGRAYYSVPFSERGKQRTPPDCTSKDALYGVGKPGGECRHCPMSQWESDPKGGRGQACKEMRRLLLLRGGLMLPELVTVPPTSLKNAYAYFQRLASYRVPYWSLVTSLRLEKASNADGIDYARITFTSGELFPENERETLRPYHNQMMNLLRDAEIEPEYEDVSHDDD